MTDRLPDLVGLYDQLPIPQQTSELSRFSTGYIPGFPHCSIGKDIEGLPVLLIATNKAIAGPVSPIVLESFRVIHLVSCRLQRSDGTQDERTLSLIQCTVSDRLLHEYFLRSLYPILQALPENPGRDDVARSVDKLLELFRQMAMPPRRAISGLWAELFLIAEATSPEQLLRCWRSTTDERFDFSLASDRIEVKSSAGSRIHHFNLEQLRPGSPIRTVVVSILVDRSQGGLSCMDLISAIRNRVNDRALLVRLDQTVAETAGQDWRSLLNLRFSEDVARTSLRILNAADVPSVAAPVPNEVSEVHFKVDLANAIATHIPGDSVLFGAI